MMSFTTSGDQKQERSNQVSFIRSQLVLLESRKKWGILYSLATVSGLFFMPGVLGIMWSGADILTIFQKVMPLPAISFLITVGMFVLNDLVDADLDRANGKKRPIPSGLVSKRQTWAFITLTNGLALLLSIITFSPISIMIVAFMLVLGILYSAPRIALMKRFVTKTVTIAIYYSLCAMLGITSIYGLDLAIDNPVILIHSLSMLSIMIFISSTLNDLGDVEGDRAAGRRTIPIVIGKDNTIKLSMILAICMVPVTWALYALTMVTGNHGSILTPASTSLFALVVAFKMSKMRKGLHDMESMRRHHKKLFPLNIILQSNLVIGGLIML
jgi:geranylgeranylglycerol-phosphate geranylgeranyltransferase